jgi:hypothetical protein
MIIYASHFNTHISAELCLEFIFLGERERENESFFSGTVGAE